MRHPFENGQSIFLLAALVALLGGYLFFSAPNTPVHVVVVDSGAGATQAAEAHAQAVTPQSKAAPPVPIGGFAVAFGVGVVALIVSVGPLLGAPIREKEVH